MHNSQHIQVRHLLFNKMLFQQIWFSETTQFRGQRSLFIFFLRKQLLTWKIWAWRSMCLLSIPDICQFRDTTALFSPVKVRQKTAWIRNKFGQSRPKFRALCAKKGLEKLHYRQLWRLWQIAAMLLPSYDLRLIFISPEIQLVIVFLHERPSLRLKAKPVTPYLMLLWSVLASWTRIVSSTISHQQIQYNSIKTLLLSHGTQPGFSCVHLNSVWQVFYEIK